MGFGRNATAAGQLAGQLTANRRAEEQIRLLNALVIEQQETNRLLRLLLERNY